MFDFPSYLKAIFLAVALLMFGYVAQAYYNQRNVSLFTWYDEPVLTDVTGTPTTELHSGQPVIMTYYIERYASRCWATHFEALDGPVIAQFGETKAMIFVERTTKVPTKLLFHIPTDLPAGKYRWKRVIYPTCGGEHAQPFVMNTGIEITIRGEN